MSDTDNLLSNEFLSKYKNKQPNWGFNGLGYVTYKRCVDEDTPVLCDDLSWKRAGDLREGDGIIGFDEEPIAKNKSKTRYLRFGKVTHNQIEEAECYGIELEDGTVLYATPDHSWLVKFKNNPSISWRDTKDLESTKYGNEVYLLRLFGKPWEKDTSFDAGYLSGAFDGEGNIEKSNSINFTQVGNCVLENVEIALCEKGFSFKKSRKFLGTSYSYKKPRQDCYVLRTYGTKNVFRFLGIIRPKRLLEKFLNTCRDDTNKRFGKQMNCDVSDYVMVKRVFKAGKRKIAVLSTDIKTHFTGGFASHNTYARLKSDGSTEEWWETIARCIEGAQKIGAKYTKEEAEKLFDYVFNLKCNFAGRMLWQLGTNTVERFGPNSLLNCWMVSVKEPKAFLFLFENLMLGGGVGFSIRREDIHELPRVKPNVKITHEATKDADFIVPDSREGWVKLLEHVLNAFYATGKSFTYSTILVRGAGEKISGFGGSASGPKILIEGIDKIVQIFQGREEKKLRSIDVLDICNIIGSIVVSGNVRRSAQIGLGDPDDHLFLKAKNWSLGNVPNWRSMSNNTIYADAYDHISNSIWENGYDIDEQTGVAKGEPYGFFNLPLSQKYGRIKDGPMKESGLYPSQKDNVTGTNPCGEISLASYECCNLSELYLNNISSKEELIECATLLYKTQKAIAAMQFLHEETNDIVHKNMRLGLGVTGVCQSLDKIAWLDDCYIALRKFDKKWSKLNNWPESIKLTTVKPSGSLSLLAGATPGIHPAYSKYYIRRIRMASSDALVKICREAGHKIEFVKNFDGSEDKTTVVIEFPCKSSDNALLAKDVTVIKQLEMVKQLQHVWSDNAVSVTAYYTPEELPDLKLWLKDNYEKYIKSVSFLLRDKHGFIQAPYEEISEDIYENTIKKIKPLEIISGGDLLEGIECEGGACPIR